MLQRILWGMLLTFVACTPDKNRKMPASADTVAQWCAPDLAFKGFDLSDLSPDEKGEWKFVLGGLEKMFEDMCVEYFDDRPGNRDSYKMTLQLPNETEPHTEFGEYELLANGQRLLMYMPDGKKLNIQLTKSDPNTQQWRLQIQDLLQFGGDLYELPEEMPNVVIYLTFHKKEALTEKG